jgi:uncharacterized protein YecE (DUF72 family)
MRRAVRNSKVEVKVGCCGFPVSMTRYFQEFRLVEIQKTFYKPPSAETLRNWRKNAPEDFEFTIKAWQKITHPPSSPTYRKAGISGEDCGFFKPTQEVFEAYEVTKEAAKILKAKIIVFQTPKSFSESDESIRNMREFFSTIQDEFMFVWEPRGWSDESVASICQELELIHAVDPFVQKPLYGKINYFRLHGAHKKMYRHKYSDEELQKLLEFCDKNSCVLFNNVYMYDDARRFLDLV